MNLWEQYFLKINGYKKGERSGFLFLHKWKKDETLPELIKRLANNPLKYADYQDFLMFNHQIENTPEEFKSDLIKSIIQNYQ